MSEISLKPEERIRHEKINPSLEEAGWEVQSYDKADIYSSKGVAVEYFPIGKEEADYILFVNGKACGVVEAKKEGVTLIGKEVQSNKYAINFPENFQSVGSPFSHE